MKAHLFVGLLASNFIITKYHFSRSSQHRIVLNEMIHLFAHLASIIGLLVDEVVHVADLAVDHIEETMHGRLSLFGKSLRQICKLLHSSAFIDRDLMHLALLVDKEHFTLGFLAPTEHIDVGERVYLLITIYIDEVSHLILPYQVDD